MRIRVVFIFFVVGLFLIPSSCRIWHETNLSRISAREFGSLKSELLEQHNERRFDWGLKPLELDKKLCDYAERHAEIMASRERLFHSSMEDLQKFCGASLVAENIAWGQQTVDDVVSDWMWSPGHRWNILGSSYKKVGFGIKEDSGGRKYWCVVFSS